MSDGSSQNPPDPTSEVVSHRAKEIHTENNETQWRLLFETQTQQMKELIQTLKTPSNNNNIVLPEFNPDRHDCDARLWCATADLCLDGNVLNGGQLIVMISKALKGSASTWLAQITYPGMTWAQFKELFTARFVNVETSAATLINLNNDKPQENETYAAYASRLVTLLLTRWKNVSIEQIAVSMVVAQLAQFDTRLQRLAFTTEITSRHQLQKELQAFSYLKRKAPMDTRTDDKNNKRPKFSSQSLIKCHACGKIGHKQAECRTRKTEARRPTPVPTSTSADQRRQLNGSSVVCYKCGNQGHIASRCTASGPSVTTPVEKRVDLCEVKSPSGVLNHFGECFKFDFDSGAECSLVKETVGCKLRGKRINNLISLVGIGNKNVHSTLQILSQVEINNFATEILCHVLPDANLRSYIMIGREILKNGFCVSVTATKLTLAREKM
ncbi:jg27892 [Pararge aegeria aegeria]|uniref:Jg27892 protein n=1 Tax=Pararge aegeria aegeria TaxID=348720 RepID=A0A8S4QIQ3_9NEOP|nr:jg27892 [Pararge aegeria aegeria]